MPDDPANAPPRPQREPYAADENGRPEDRTRDPAGTPYGEPRGPRPPHFDILPKDEIERRAANGAPDAPASADGRYETEAAAGNFHSGRTTPEADRTTGDQRPGTIGPRAVEDDRDGGT